MADYIGWKADRWLFIHFSLEGVPAKNPGTRMAKKSDGKGRMGGISEKGSHREEGKKKS